MLRVTRFFALAIATRALSVAVLALAPAKDFSLPSAAPNGPLIHLSDYAGKVVLVNWWRTSCAWSQQEAPKLAALYQKYKDKGFVIVGVSDDTSDTLPQLPAYLTNYHVTWPVGLNDQGEIVRDLVKSDHQDTPQTFLVSPNGEVTPLGLDRDAAAWQRLEAAVAQALASPPAGSSSLHAAALEPAPPLSLPDMQGKTVTLASFAGHPVVLMFFTAQSCDWAGAAMAKLGKDYAAKGVQVVGVDLYDDDAQVNACAQKHGATYPILKGTQAAQRAWIGSDKGWATFFITRDGRVFKKILNSIENGLEAQVLPKYADYLAAR